MPRRRKANAKEKSLAELLKHECYLWKVLSCLVDSDLQECRLVCRRWRKMCSRLPVKLQLHPTEASLAAVQKFPNAISVALRTSTREELARAFWCRKDVLDCLKSMKALTHFTAPLDSDPELLECIRSLQTLESLDLSNSCIPAVAAADILLSLKHLTQFSTASLQENFQEKPLTAVRNLKELGISREFLVTHTGQFMFPLLTKLTRLDLSDGAWWRQLLPGSDNSGAMPFSLNAHFPSLAVLKFVPLNFFDDLNLHDLQLLTSLETLDIRSASVDDPDLFKNLCLLQKLKALTLCEVQIEPQHTAFECLSTLKQLESLTLYPIYTDFYENQLDPPCLSEFTGLTKLHIYSCEGTKSLPHLASLRDVHIVVRGSDTRTTPDVVSSLTNLESLFLDTIRMVPSSVVLPLKKLKELSLICARVGKDFVSVLSCLTDLTYLDLTSCNHNTFFRDINQLSHLLSLGLKNYIPEPEHSCMALGGGKLSRLRYLTLTNYVLDDDEQRALMKKLPSLRRLSVD